MKKMMKGLLAAAAFTVCLAGGAKGAQAKEYQPPCIPEEKALKEYQKDGTLQERMAYYENSAGTKVSESLIEKALLRERGSSKVRSNLPDNWENMNGGMPTEGNAKVLLLHVDFPDEKFEAGDTKEALEEIAFGANNAYAPYDSLTAYYERASYGKLHIDGEVYSYTAKNNREYYENDIESLFTEAMRDLDDELDYDQFDGDKDGYLDGVYLHFAGNDDGWGSTWWSITNNSLGQETFDGVRMGKYVTLHNPSNTKWGAQTLIHETGHVLGLPDFYAPSQNYTDGIKTYDMMYMNTGDYNGFSKWLLGWISEDQVVRITKDNWRDMGSVTLESLSEQGNGSSPKIAVISPEDQGIFSEYFVVEYDTCVENQKTLTFNGETLPDGFRIFHVNAELAADGRGFANGNWSADQTKLIELVDPDEELPHGDIPGEEGGYDHITGPYEAESYHCKFMDGDSLTPVSSPNSAFEGGIYKGYTGITIDSFVTGNGISGSFSASFGEESLQPDPDDFKLTAFKGWQTADQGNIVIVPLELSMEASVSADGISPVIRTKDGKEVRGRIERLTDSQILFVAETDSLAAGTASVIFPDGYFDLGMGVASNEIRMNVSIAENAEKSGGFSINFGNSFNGVAAFDGGWYVLMSDENQLRLYRIASDGKVGYENLNVSSWEGWIAPGEGNVENIMILSDGTLVLKGNDWLEGALKLAHIDQDGKLLDDIVKLDRSDYELAVAGNTVKLYRTEFYELQELLSVDFKGEARSVEITDRMRYSTILFTGEGYLVQYYDDRDKSYLCFDLYDADDELTDTFEYGIGENEPFETSEFCAAASADGKLYLFALLQDYEEIWSASDTMYITGEMWCYMLDQKTGEFLGRTLVDKQLRFTKNTNSYIGPELVTASGSDDMIMLHVKNRIDGKYLDDSHFYLTDSYFIDLQGNLVSETSSINSMKVSFQSGKLLTAGAWQDGKVVFSIHNAVKDQGDTVKPDPKPEQPEGDKVPGKQPAGSENTNISASQIEKPAKTGDSFTMGIYAVMIIAAGTAAALVIRKRRSI